MDSTECRQGDETHIRLLVKAPDQQVDDQTVECTLDWTVLKLKEHLNKVYPSRPKREDQKIIFLGQLLTDSMILRDVLQQDYNKEDRLFIVHLVCGGQTSATLVGKTSMSSIDVNVNSQPSNFDPAATELVQPTPVQRYYSQLNNQQVTWMQQAYAHYLTRYMQIMAAQGIQVQSNTLYSQPLSMNRRAGASTNNSSARFNDNNNLEDNDLAVDADEAAEVPGVVRDRDALVGQQEGVVAGNVANNNQNAAANVAGPAARDWLDIFDMISRIVVFSSIVYFYSSPSRFLLVTFLGFVIYLIQGGFFRGQPVFLGENNDVRLIDNNNQVRQDPVIPPPQIPVPTPQGPRIPSESREEQDTDATRMNLNEENERPGAWAFTWTFFSSFFASLIPDQPNVI